MRQLKFFVLIFILLKNATSLSAVTVENAAAAFQSEVSNLTNSGASLVNQAINELQNLINDISEISCESKEVLKIYKGAMDHTCTPTPLASILVSQLLAPNSMATLMRLSMNNKELLGYDNCAIYNRAEYYSPSVEFGMCVNKKLTLNKFIGMGEGIIASIGAVFKGQNVIDAYKKHATLPPDKIYDKITLSINGTSNSGDSKFIWDIPFPPVPNATNIPLMPLKLTRVDDKVCVSVQGFTTVTVGCKYTKDPYELSKYAKFMGVSDALINKSSNNNSTYKALQERSIQDLNCSNLNSCYYKAVEGSKTLLPISAPIINCVKDMLIRFLVNPQVCTFNDPTSINAAATLRDSAFYIFQKNLQKAVVALLMLYIMLNGAKIFLGGMASQSAIIMFIIKVVLVTYFSIGINLSANGPTFSGMIDIIFPFLFQGINDIASWIISAGSSQLCAFNASDYGTSDNYSLWDALDCRVASYLGISGFTDLYTSLRASGNVNLNTGLTSGLSTIDYSIPPYFLLVVPAVFSGNISLIMLSLSFPILIISIAAYTVQSFVLCMIFIAILGMLAPLFVPMALFEYTYGYFENWMKLVFSFVLQPAVSITFGVLVFSIYDWGFYGTCKYRSINIIMPDSKILKSFFIDVKNADANCKNTIGWWLADKFDFGNINQISLEDLNLVKANGSAGGVKAMQDIAITGAVSVVATTGTVVLDVVQGLGDYLSSGNFITVPTAPLKGFFQVVSSMLIACFAIYVGYQVSDQLANFAADMTGGISLGAVTSSPKQTFDKIMAAANAAGGAAGGGGSGGGKGGAPDAASTGSNAGGQGPSSTGSKAGASDAARSNPTSSAELLDAAKSKVTDEIKKGIKKDIEGSIRQGAGNDEDDKKEDEASDSARGNPDEQSSGGSSSGATNVRIGPSSTRAGESDVKPTSSSDGKKGK